MTLDLSAVDFINDFFTFDLPDGNVLTLNVIDESLVFDTQEQDINLINVQLTLYAVNEETGENEITGYIKGVNVIGMESETMKIGTDYKEYTGQPLTKDNIKYCYLEYKDEQ